MKKQKEMEKLRCCYIKNILLKNPPYCDKIIQNFTIWRKTMAMITCPECGKQISDKADKCPNCGYPLDFKNKNENSENVKKKLF